MADDADKSRALRLLGRGDADRELVEHLSRTIAGKEAHQRLTEFQHATMEGVPVELWVPPDLRGAVSTEDVERP